MNKRSLKVLAVASYCEPVTADQAQLPDLKELVKEATGVAIRRVNRFVQLALIGAGRCARQQPIDSATGVYFASCRGDTQVTIELLEDLIKNKELPGPLTFVNSVSNAACFQVANALGLHERSNFVTNRFDPIVAAIKAAWLDLGQELSTALVGSVDACSLPLDDHLRRTQRPAGLAAAEASHWMLLADSRDSRPALAKISAVRNFSERETMLETLREMRLSSETVLAPGQHLSAQDADMMISALKLSGLFDYRAGLPDYDSQSAAAIEQFIGSGHSAMLHLNSDPTGRYSLLVVER